MVFRLDSDRQGRWCRTAGAAWAGGLVRYDDGPAVLLGNFNDCIGDFVFGPLLCVGLHASFVRSHPTWFIPLLALDRVLVREPMAFVRHWRRRKPPAAVASDYFPLVTDLRRRWGDRAI
jgi:endonuclease/exonuclease/phosphatase family metal-dependent hydrolase